MNTSLSNALHIYTHLHKAIEGYEYTHPNLRLVTVQGVQLLLKYSPTKFKYENQDRADFQILRLFYDLSTTFL